jgi:hypothetical protein
MLFEFPKFTAKAPDVLANIAASPCLQVLRGYWEGLRENGALPHRHDIHPSGLGGALSNIFMIERVAAGMGRFRMAGSTIADLMGNEPRGLPLTLLLEPLARDTLSKVLDEVFTSATALDIILRAERGIGRPVLAGRMIILPVHCGKGAYHQAICALALSGEAGGSPRRFGINHIRCENIDAKPSFIAPQGKSMLARRLPDFAAPDVAAPGVAAITPKTPGSHLRLVHSAN